MNKQKAIELEARISAIEFLLCKVNLATILSATPIAQIDQMLDDFASDARKQIFPGLSDAALSDLVSAEWEDAIARLVKMQKEILAQYRVRKGL